MVKTSMSSSAMMTSTCTVSGSDVSSRTSRCHIQAVLLEGGTAPEFPYRWNTAANGTQPRTRVTPSTTPFQGATLIVSVTPSSSSMVRRTSWRQMTV